MRVLVTGATGFVGGAIARRFCAAGHEVVGVSRRTSDALPATVRQVQVDLGAASFLDHVAGEIPLCEVIVHAAAAIDMRPDNPAVSLTNCLGTHQIVMLARVWGVKHLVYLSSLPVIGRPMEWPITEEHPRRPLTVYHASKLYGEHVVDGLRQEGVASASLRLTAPVGPGMPQHRFLSILVRHALRNEPILLNGTGARRQNYVDVRDIAAAVEQCAAQRACGVFHVGGAESLSNRKLAETCIAALGSASVIAFSGTPDPEDNVAWDVSIAKAARSFGYLPTYSIRDTIRSVAEGIRATTA